MFSIYIICVLFFSSSVFADSDDYEPSQEKVITFNRTDGNGLTWPLPDWNDAGILLTHAIHCVRKVQNYNEEDFSEMNLMHGNHCADIIKHYVSFFSHTQTYSAQALLCKDTRQLTRVKRFAPGTYDYLRLSWRKRRDLYQYQNDLFSWESGNNLGYLLMKKWQNPSDLTKDEAEYLNEITRPAAVRIGALSVYCNFGENVTTILTMLAQNLATYENKRSAQRRSTSDYSID